MTKGAKLCATAALSLSMAACSTFQTNTSVPITSTSSRATLQLAVGTLHDASGLLVTPGVYLNAEATFRNAQGVTAFSNPGDATLSGPGALSVQLGAIYAWGQSPGVNYTLGEPPAFSPQNLDGGYSTGYILTFANATAGTYTLSTNVVTDGHSKTYSASATLPNAPTVLPSDPLPSWTSDGKGGGTFAMTNPSGVTESIIFVQAASGAYVTTVELKSPATSVSVPDGTLTVGTTYYEFCIGADYPIVESAVPNNTQATPPLAGSGGTADITTSDPAATAFTE